MLKEAKKLSRTLSQQLCTSVSIGIDHWDFSPDIDGSSETFYHLWIESHHQFYNYGSIEDLEVGIQSFLIKDQPSQKAA